MSFTTLRLAACIFIPALTLLPVRGSAEDAYPSLSCASPAAPVPGSPPVEGELIVHEWGTFTSFSGSDGVRLEFRPLVDNDLPDFVIDRATQSGKSIFLKSAIRARQRMETPVVYFYTDRLRQVRVQVGFPQGLLTEFYPPVARMLPEGLSAATGQSVLPADQLRDSLLDWGRVTLLPEAVLRPAIADGELAAAVARRALAVLPPGMDPEPDLYTGDHYYFARETDAALVHVRRGDEPPVDGAADTAQALLVQRPRGDFFEKFLFYRGVGNFELPVTVTSAPDGGIRILNSGPQPLTGLVLIDVAEESLRFARLEDVAAESRLTLDPAAAFDANGVENPQAALWNTVHEILVEQGLYEKEATAMVRTWAGSWFREPGLRLLYVVPRPVTDALLPLTIEPSPQSTVRVLVGRLEILPQAVERRIEGLVEASAARWTSLTAEEQAAAPHAPESILRLGRLAEPALTRVALIAERPEVRAEARRLIAALRAREGLEPQSGGE